jgi:hypothetical protein
MVGVFFMAHSATVLAGVKLVRPVGRSNLTPAAVRRIEQLRRSHPLGMTLLTHDPSTDKELHNPLVAGSSPAAPTTSVVFRLRHLESKDPTGMRFMVVGSLLNPSIPTGGPRLHNALKAVQEIRP